MRQTTSLGLKFLVPLAITLALLAYAVVPLVDSLTLRWFTRDLDTRSHLIVEALNDSVVEASARNEDRRVLAQFDRVIRDERLFALGFCATDGKLRAKTRTFPDSITCTAGDRSGGSQVLPLADGPVHVAHWPVRQGETLVGQVVVVHDMSFIQKRSTDTRRYVIAMFTILGVVVAFVTMIVAHLSWRGWMAGVRAVLRGEGIIKPFDQPRPELQPLVGDLRQLLRDMEDERRGSDEEALQWTPEKLKRLLREQLAGDEVILVSNREPYIHNSTASGIVCQRPASGLVTAVEPVMRACSGTWIAHGSGSADRESSDADGRVQVPPSSPSYTLRRIWLEPEEEQGYYYGFSNEGLWPLCHICHVRPVFRSEDWQQYRRINRRFADAVIAEARTEDPVVLVQDYHLALVPRMVRDRLPRATIITFWHIPWPNPESFGICPWREEILDGLLGSTILGFHTGFHARNFLDTVDRFLETRIEPEQSTVSYGGKLTRVEHYPISIDWPAEHRNAHSVASCRRELRSRLGMPEDQLVGLGVDRLDYTKGIVERFTAVERMLELYPQWVGVFTFVQIAAPSRSSLDEYKRFEELVRSTANRINARFGRVGYRPIKLLIEHHDSESVFEHYRGCDVCLVTSLHDGMNLVAKEFVAARDDEQGVLVLSQFAGAARELHEALIVNPYHTDEVARALHQGLAMPAEEQRERLRSLRRLVREFNVYRWAGRMLLDAARLRRRQRVAARIHLHSAEQPLRKWA